MAFVKLHTIEDVEVCINSDHVVKIIPEANVCKPYFHPTSETIVDGLDVEWSSYVKTYKNHSTLYFDNNTTFIVKESFDDVVMAFKLSEAK